MVFVTDSPRISTRTISRSEAENFQSRVLSTVDGGELDGFSRDVERVSLKCL